MCVLVDVKPSEVSKALALLLAPAGAGAALLIVGFSRSIPLSVGATGAIGAPFTIWLCGASVLAAVGAFALTGTLGVIREGLALRKKENK